MKKLLGERRFTRWRFVLVLTNRGDGANTSTKRQRVNRFRSSEQRVGYNEGSRPTLAKDIPILSHCARPGRSVEASQYYPVTLPENPEPFGVVNFRRDVSIPSEN